jgi:hypothetical protein
MRSNKADVKTITLLGLSEKTLQIMEKTVLMNYSQIVVRYVLQFHYHERALKISLTALKCDVDVKSLLDEKM